MDIRDWVLRRKQWKAIPLLSAVFWGALKKASLWAYAAVKLGGDLDFLGIWGPLWGFVKEWDWVIVPLVGIFGLWWIGREKPGTPPSVPAKAFDKGTEKEQESKKTEVGKPIQSGEQESSQQMGAAIEIKGRPTESKIDPETGIERLVLMYAVVEASTSETIQGFRLEVTDVLIQKDRVEGKTQFVHEAPAFGPIKLMQAPPTIFPSVVRHK